MTVRAGLSYCGVIPVCRFRILRAMSHTGCAVWIQPGGTERTLILRS